MYKHIDIGFQENNEEDRNDTEPVEPETAGLKDDEFGFFVDPVKQIDMLNEQPVRT